MSGPHIVWHGEGHVLHNQTSQSYSYEVLLEIQEICDDFTYLNDVLLFILMPMGVFGNALCIYMYRRKNLVKSNLSPFNINISAWNIIYMIYFMFVIESEQIYGGWEIEFVHDYVCVAVVFFKQVLREIPIWFEVYLTVDRFFSICYPNKLKWLRKREHITPICFLLIFICCVLNVENLWYYLEFEVPLWPDGEGVSTEFLGYKAPLNIT